MSENKSEAIQNIAVWFEIPAVDFERAAGFYERLLEVKLLRDTAGPMQRGVFPYNGTSVSGSVTKGDRYQPGNSGPVVYLNCDGKIDAVLTRVPAAGGKVVVPRTELPNGNGSMAIIIDTEGNRVGLHSAM